jgi:hypothetical protein
MLPAFRATTMGDYSILPSQNFCFMDPVTCWHHFGSLSNASCMVPGKLSASRFGTCCLHHPWERWIAHFITQIYRVSLPVCNAQGISEEGRARTFLLPARTHISCASNVPVDWPAWNRSMHWLVHENPVLLPTDSMHSLIFVCEKKLVLGFKRNAHSC